MNQNHEFVRFTLKSWVFDTVKTYGFDGIRVAIDTVPEVSKNFWAEYCQAAGVYSVSEVFNGNQNYVADYQGSLSLSALFNYPMTMAETQYEGGGSST